LSPRSNAFLFVVAAAVATLVALPRPAAAQNFPTAAAEWFPLPCGTANMTDGVGDTPNASGGLDIVGTAANPAGYHAADKNYLYLRLRVAADPRMAGVLTDNAWGFAIDLDQDYATYELLFTLSGLGPDDTVAIYTNGNTQTRNDLADPADMPPLHSYPASSNAELVSAGSAVGGGSDWFIDIALPWSDLNLIPLAAASRIGVWAGTSTVANALDLDIACWAGPGGGHMSDSLGTGYTTADPHQGTSSNGGAGGSGGGGTGGSGGAGGTGSGGTGPRAIEGGPGCALLPSARAPFSALLLLGLAVALLLARRTRR
jgi:hypothetical protein